MGVPYLYASVLSGFGMQIVQFEPATDPVPPVGFPVVGLIPATLGNWYIPS